MDRREILAARAVGCEGDWAAIADSIRRDLPVPTAAVRDSYITIYDSDYPQALRQLRFPPWVLFYEGNPDLLRQPAVTIVGSRQAGRYGELATRKVAGCLYDRFVIVSGLARGVDAIAHSRAISLGGHTIGVIGAGLDVHYPACNEQLYRRMAADQLILSEYPRGVGVRREHFPWRNRILAALGQAVIVTQATLHSGTMLTVNEAIALSRDIYCVPYPLGDELGRGCDHLIEQGANILFDVRQLSDLQPRPGNSQNLQNTKE